MSPLLLLLACSGPTPPAGVEDAFKDNGFRIVEHHPAVVDGQPVQITTVTRDPVDPATLDAACGGGDLIACHQRGEALLGQGRYAEMEQAWLALCEKGHKPACGDLAYQYANPFIQVPGRETHGLEVTTRACELHAQPISCALLASVYEKGAFGVQPDAVRAETLTRQACADQHYASCQKLGLPFTP